MLCTYVEQANNRKSLHPKQNRRKPWAEGAKSGCTFCRLILHVIEDASQRYRCTDPWGVHVTQSPGGPFCLYLHGVGIELPNSTTSFRFVIGSITVYLKDSSISLPLPGFKSMPRRATGSACLNLAQQWLSTCRSEHPTCNNKYDTLGPSRLVDIPGSTIKLVPQSGKTVLHPYVALSHCWGDAQPLKSTIGNIASMQQFIPSCDLPQTFLDAIQVCRAQAYDYIWIDSLCIIQDSIEDWEQQSSIMASIYSNADLVLAGAAAKSASEGFLRDRNAWPEGTVTLQVGGGFQLPLLTGFCPCKGTLKKNRWKNADGRCKRGSALAVFSPMEIGRCSGSVKKALSSSRTSSVCARSSEGSISKASWRLTVRTILDVSGDA
ncbi:HET-domain-containing protein [Decorospora gaudefroyi]|uniref:HET-domain-containing protein n=1 Tax=Decorospora gaudefroyi TaxID=184978 RepID=A0A6A5KEH7_9PLEO|nr:HET-domain-containing protein [Decorospora gaudefroyi]